MMTPPAKIQVASFGKRLIAFLLDFGFVLLLVNTIKSLQTPMNWDLQGTPTSSWWQVVATYLAMVGLLVFKDLIRGQSLGKFILGIHVLDPLLQEVPSPKKLIQRNLSLFLFPLEAILILLNPYARRFGDRWIHTVVSDNPKRLRVSLRVLAANTIFFGSFFSVLLLQPWMIRRTAAYQSTLERLKHHSWLIQQLGGPVSFIHPEMSLNFNVNPPTAEIQLEADGKHAQWNVKVFLTYVPLESRWQVDRIERHQNTKKEALPLE